MAFAVQARLEGVERAMKNLKNLSRTVRNKILRQAINASSRPVLAAAKALVPKGSGMLRRSLAVRVQTYRQSGAVVALIGPRTGTTKTRQGKKQTSFGAKIKETGQNPAYYAHLVEFGRTTVVRKKRKALSDGGTIFGTQVRAVPARPFLRPAFESQKGRVVSTMSQLIADGIGKFAEAARQK